MEHFLHDYRVIERFAINKNGNKLPLDLFTKIMKSLSLFSATDTTYQIFLSALDLRLHGKEIHTGGNRTDIHSLVADTYLQYMGTPYFPQTYVHGTFSHLDSSYAAAYYSYLYSRMHSSVIWKKLFMDNPLSREAGEKYRRYILEPGMTKEPNVMLQNIGAAASLDSLVSTVLHEY